MSTEDFRVPYTLEGSVRAFNQDLLNKDLIEEQLVFYTIEKTRSLWRFFDPRTYRSGTLRPGIPGLSDGTTPLAGTLIPPFADYGAHGAYHFFACPPISLRFLKVCGATL